MGAPAAGNCPVCFTGWREMPNLPSARQREPHSGPTSETSTDSPRYGHAGHGGGGTSGSKPHAGGTGGRGHGGTDNTPALQGGEGALEPLRWVSFEATKPKCKTVPLKSILLPKSWPPPAIPRALQATSPKQRDPRHTLALFDPLSSSLLSPKSSWIRESCLHPVLPAP